MLVYDRFQIICLSLEFYHMCVCVWYILLNKFIYLCVSKSKDCCDLLHNIIKLKLYVYLFYIVYGKICVMLLYENHSFFFLVYSPQPICGLCYCTLVRKASPSSDLRTNFLYHNVVKRQSVCVYKSIYLKTLKSCDDMQ